jgi:hypothetical protein
MDEIREMTWSEAGDYLDAWSELTGEPKKTKKYLVLRKVKEKTGKQEVGVKEVGASAAPKISQSEGE